MSENLMSMQTKFDSIYRTNEWSNGSGPGSLSLHSLPYINFLESFIQENKIKTILDFGCGDWQFSNIIRWGDVQYFGFDIVPSVIEQNTKKYGCGKYKFNLFNGDFSSLPQADLLICKDVLQHWSNKDIQNFFPILKNHQYSLITNCADIVSGEVYQGCVVQNQDIPNGYYRKLDLQNEPFNWKGQVVFSYTNNLFLSNHKIEWFKKTLLVTHQEINKS